jgi:hypothetical protein
VELDSVELLGQGYLLRGSLRAAPLHMVKPIYYSAGLGHSTKSVRFTVKQGQGTPSLGTVNTSYKVRIRSISSSYLHKRTLGAQGRNSTEYNLGED